MVAMLFKLQGYVEIQHISVQQLGSGSLDQKYLLRRTGLTKSLESSNAIVRLCVECHTLLLQLQKLWVFHRPMGS